MRRTQHFCEITTLDLSYVVTVKSTVEISQSVQKIHNFVVKFKDMYVWCSIPSKVQEQKFRVIFHLDLMLLIYIATKWKITQTLCGSFSENLNFTREHDISTSLPKLVTTFLQLCMCHQFINKYLIILPP